MPIKVTIPAAELFDESTYEYFNTRETTLTLEHSLVSVSKWESKWEIPFMKDKLEGDKLSDYIRCMTITQNVDPNVYKAIPLNIQNEIIDYVNSKQTATWIKDDKKSRSNRVVTSELIYFWMIKYGVPFECEKWHLNRLIMLIRVCQEESNPSGKMTIAERRALNKARKSKFHTKG